LLVEQFKVFYFVNDGNFQRMQLFIDCVNKSFRSREYPRLIVLELDGVITFFNLQPISLLCLLFAENIQTYELPSSTAAIKSSQKTIDRINLDFLARRSTVFLTLL
jgi:hypothetical protein